jgi:NifB/MoaA-like Fe-S oxidoreductase
LLVGQDIYSQLKDRALGDYIFLPPRVLNHDGLLLDDWSVINLSDKLGVPVHVYKESILDIVDVIRQLRLSINDY